MKVPRAEGEEVRRELTQQKLLNYKARIKSDDGFVYIPLKRRIKGSEIGSFKVMERRDMKDLMRFIPSYDVVGDIAIIKDGDGKIGDAILAVHKNIKVVARQTSTTKGSFRTKDYKIVAGEYRTETVHREYGCKYALDIQKVYFNPRLSTERARVASLIKNNETVIDMFAGVGSFTVQIAKKAQKVIAIDINPDAIRYLWRNIALNALKNVEVLHGDVRIFASRLRNCADRIIMNLPLSANEFLGDAFAMIKRGGVIHYYTIHDEEAITEVAEDKGSRIHVLNKRKVKTYAPHKYTMVIDAAVA